MTHKKAFAGLTDSERSAAAESIEALAKDLLPDEESIEEEVGCNLCAALSAVAAELRAGTHSA